MDESKLGGVMPPRRGFTAAAARMTSMRSPRRSQLSNDAGERHAPMPNEKVVHVGFLVNGTGATVEGGGISEIRKP